MATYKCPNCGKTIDVPDWLNTELKCPACRSVIPSTKRGPVASGGSPSALPPPPSRPARLEGERAPDAPPDGGVPAASGAFPGPGHQFGSVVPSIRKAILFGLLGVAGCTLGWLLGEPLLAVMRPRDSQASGATPSLLFSDDLKARLEREGAKTGDVQIALMWHNYNDLDLHCVDPQGEEIFFSNKRAWSGGELDVDMNAGGPHSNKPVENIFWPADGAPPGKYRVYVNHYANHGGRDPTDFRCEVGVQGQVKKFTGSLTHGDPKQLVYEFTLGSSHASPSRFWYTAMMQGLWTALLSLGLAYALVIGQNRHMRRPWLSPGQASLLLVGGTTAGVIAGGGGQVLFGVVGQYHTLAQIGRILGWVLLGCLLGRGVGHFIPNLSKKRAAWAGSLGGLVGALAFLSASGPGNDALGRFLGAAILGLAIGLMVALVEAAFRQAWLEVSYGPKETIRVNLGAERVSVGGDSRACTIFAFGAPPVALRYRLVGGKIECQDVVSGRTSEVAPGARRTVGNATVTVCAARPVAETMASSGIAESF